MAAVEFRLERSVRIHTLHSRVSMLQELCRRRLVATRSLPRWKTLTQVFTECPRRRACLSSLVHFSGCGVSFCMQRNFFEWDHMTYWISCVLDRKRYMAVRAPNYNAERLLGDDNLWHWALLDHPHVLSVVAVAAIAPIIQVYLITLAPDDGLEHFTGILAVRDLCVHELHPRKFLRQLCSTLVYFRERLPGNDNLWHWAPGDHPHVLSVLAVAANAPGIQAHMVTLTPNDGLEQFAGILAVSDLCIHELHLWKSLHLLCSALIYLRGQGWTARPFELFNVYLHHTDLGLHNALVWNRRPFEITSQPGSLWSLLLRLHDGLATVYAVISTTEHAATNFLVTVVVANSADPADTISR
ncbi:uncharacterized protein LOC142765956 [Rhipicephalus microplus]|uniref:uncharacterized protein LOC142765956 n=1 Tax=Rhipicephalus microplus TaxID=6941 RepID=UPI003F6A5E95